VNPALRADPFQPSRNRMAHNRVTLSFGGVTSKGGLLAGLKPLKY
jgi:hypothetical protein